MLKLGKIAVTGGLSSGKTSVCRFLKELGAYVLSADEIVHQLLSSDPLLIQQVVDLLGPEICREGKIDRKRVAAIVFNEPERLESLEKILHPKVRNVINQCFKESEKNPQHPLFVVEIPLLFEAKFDQDYDFTLAVISDEEKCKSRFQKPEEYEQRMSRQMTPHEKSKKADFTLENNGSLEDLFQKVKSLYKHLIPIGKINPPS